MLSKKEAAEYLGISSRTLERHVKDGKIGVRYQPGATNDVAMFDEQDLESFKNDRQAPKIKPTIVQPSSELVDQPQTDPTDRIAQTSSGGFLAPIITPFRDFSERLFSFPFLLQGKILVTLNEAQIITGLSREILMNAIKSGELEAKIMGKAYRIKRKELDRYIDDLWN
jgi:excisionase family DNA binding protein